MSWWDSVVQSFQDQWWVFIITLSIVVGVLLLLSLFSKGKIIKFKTVIKVSIHCVIGFVLLFVINLFGGLFSGGSWAIVPKWYSWILIGIFGTIGVIFMVIAYFAWPGIFTEIPITT